MAEKFDYAKYLRPGNTKEEIDNLLRQAKPDASVKAYKPTLRDRLALALGVGGILPEQTVEGLAGSRGIGSTGTGLVDFTPLGVPLSLDEARRAAATGNYGEAALDLAGVAPIPGAKGAKGAAKAVIGHNSGKVAKAAKAAKAAEDFGPNELPLPARANYAENLRTFEPLPGTPEGALPVYLGPDARAVVEARGKQMELKPKERVQPDPNALGLDLSPESYRRTLTDVPQTRMDIPFPTAEQQAKMPSRGRAAPLLDEDRVNAISDRMVADIQASGHLNNPDDPHLQFFYGLHPLKQVLTDEGVPAEEAQRQIGTFGKYYAATSPRTSTENNLRNASLLSALEAQNPGIDFSHLQRGGLPELTYAEKQGGAKQAMFHPRGYPMMQMHTDLANVAERGGLSLAENTKPALFAEASAGNMANTVADTHNIRAVMHVWNQLEPGGIHPGWLKPKARERYAADPTTLDVSKDVEDTLGGHTVKGKYSQTEYGVVSRVTDQVAEKLGVSPTEAQAIMWFLYGEHTGLDSAPKSIVQLFQDRASVTGKLIGMDPKEVILKVMRRELPLAALFGGAVGAGIASSGGGQPPPRGDYAAGLNDQQQRVY